MQGELEGAVDGEPLHLFPHREQITPMQTQLEAQVNFCLKKIVKFKMWYMNNGCKVVFKTMLIF